MNNWGSIGEILFFVPVAVLFLAIVGLVWTPFGTLICAFVARFRGLKGEPYAAAAAKSSVLLLLPWVYLVIRLSFGRSLSRFAVMPVYVLIYATWFYFAALSVGWGLASIIDLFVTQSNSFEQDVVAMMLFGMIAPVNIYTFIASLKKLHRRYALDRKPADHKGTLIPDGTYLEPFAGLIGWSVVMLFVTVIVGLFGYVGT